MISIKTASYTLEELRLLEELFSNMQQQIYNTRCPQIPDCRSCKYRHVCMSVDSVCEFLHSILS